MEGDDDRVGVPAERRLVRRGGSVARPRRALGPASTTSADGRPMIDDPLVRERLARAAAGNELKLPGSARRRGSRADRPPCPVWRGRWPSSSPRSTTSAACRTCSTCSAPTACGATATSGAPADGWIEATYRHKPGHDHLRGHLRGATQHHRPTRPRAPPIRLRVATVLHLAERSEADRPDRGPGDPLLDEPVGSVRVPPVEDDGADGEADQRIAREDHGVCRSGQLVCDDHRAFDGSRHRGGDSRR